MGSQRTAGQFARVIVARLFVASMFVLPVLAGAAAHHGWSWADADQIELKGTIRDIYIGPPHPTLDIETASDGVWRVELGNPRQTERAGFVESSAKVGDEIVAIGNRSQDAGEKRMKAVRITVGGKTYDIYPERIRTN
ncbi:MULTISPECIES: DUF6152 family protein [Chelatococcus]|uniref:DUF6152 family protein n=1 Tax=Chelatococcus sp. XZ-Ab1 TaxID=3034027 RepID=UPI000A968D26|nr:MULTISPECIES: DUF6152 family protein [Chelatococcus]